MTNKDVGEDLIVSRLTAEVSAAIATIGVHGKQAAAMVQRFALLRHQPARAGYELGRVHYVTWRSPDLQGDEQLVLCQVDEQTIELHCHGGVAISRRIVDDLLLAGAELVPASEWPRRRFPIGSAIRFAAEQALIKTTSSRAALILLDQVNGALDAALQSLLDEMRVGNAQGAAARVQRLLDLSTLGCRLSRPWRIVLAGPPNVGKSSLINAISGRQRAIVHHQPGTTRDWLEVESQLDGWPVLLTDTAGIRQAEDDIESQGIERARQQISLADKVLLVVDAAVGWTDTHAEMLAFINGLGKSGLIVLNKVDLAEVGGERVDYLRRELAIGQSPLPIIECSCAVAGGVKMLIDTLGLALEQNGPSVGEAVPFLAEHVKLLREAKESLGEGNLARAIETVQQLA